MTIRGSSAPTRLEGTQLLLRPVRREDARAAFDALHGRDSILRWLRWRGPRSRMELEAAFDTWTRPAGDASDFLFAVLERENQRFVGTLEIRFGGPGGNGDLGYWLAEDVWGKGYGTEAVRLACCFCFRQLKAVSLCALVFVGNVGSRTVLERNGFTLMRVAPRKTELEAPAATGRPGRPGRVDRDEWYFVLLAEEWLERESNVSPAPVEIGRT